MLSPSVTRIGSNYARLVVGFGVGLLVVRWLFGLGPEAFGVISVIAVATGIVASVRDVLVASLLPEMARALHGADPDRLAAVAHHAWRASVVAGLATALLMLGGGIVFTTSTSILTPTAACLMLSAMAADHGVLLATSPALCYRLSTERMATYNAWITGERLVDAIAAGATLGLGSGALSDGWLIACYATCSSLARSAVCTAFAIRTLKTAAEIRPSRTGRKCPEGFRRSLRETAYAGLTLNLLSRAGTVIMYGVFGAQGAGVFVVGNRFANYARQASMGLVGGVDAVTARVIDREGVASLPRELRESTKIQASLVVPLGSFAVLRTEDLLACWLGDAFAVSSDYAFSATLITRLLILGVMARALSDGSMKALAGAGRVAVYSRLLATAAAIYPLTALLAAAVLPRAIGLYAPAALLALTLVVTHQIALPIAIARDCGVSLRYLLEPLARSAAALVAALAISTPFSPSGDSLTSLLAHATLLCCAYGVAYVLIVLDAKQRASVRSAPRRLWRATRSRWRTDARRNPRRPSPAIPQSPDTRRKLEESDAGVDAPPPERTAA